MATTIDIATGVSTGSPQGHGSIAPASDGRARPPQQKMATDATPSHFTEQEPAHIDHAQLSRSERDGRGQRTEARAPATKRRATTAASITASYPTPVAQEAANEGTPETVRNASQSLATSPRRAMTSAPEMATQAAPVVQQEAAKTGPPETAIEPAPPLANSPQPATAVAPETATSPPPANKQEAAKWIAPETASAGLPSPAVICAELVQLERRRIFCIRMQQRIDGGLRSALARQLGFHNDLPEAERKRIFNRVSVLRRAVVAEDKFERLSEVEAQLASEWGLLILQTEQSRLGWDDQRKGVEARMRSAAEQLPVWEWASGVKGFSSLGLAAIVGEACSPAAPELGDYRSHQNLCKRLGIGVVDSRRQGSPGGEATAEDWKRHGYSRERRALVWAFLDDVMLRAQWRAEKVDGETVIEAAKPLGVYGAIYARQAAEYERRGWVHAKRAARRYMAKALLRDLWRQWRAK